MNKRILFTFLVSIVLLLSGCGSNDKADSSGGGTNGDAVTMDKNPLILDKDKKQFSLTIPITKNYDENIDVILKDFRLSIPGCTIESNSLIFDPSTLVLNGSKNSMDIIRISGNFTEACDASDYILSVSQTITDGTNSRSETLTLESTGTEDPSSDPSNSEGYMFMNATTPMDITESMTNYELKVQLIKDGYIIDGKDIKMKPFSRLYGDIEEYTVTTGKDGYGTFMYHPPSNMPESGTTTALQIDFTDDNNITISERIILHFTSTPAPRTDYRFTNVSHIVVSKGSQKEDIKVQLTYNGIPVSGKTVTMDAFDASKGSILNSYTVETDSVGYATFIYEAPVKINDINNTTLPLILRFSEGGTSLEENATVFFDEKVIVIIQDVKPTVVLSSENPLKLETNSKAENIEIKVFKEGAPYMDGQVKVKLPDEAIQGADVGLFESYNVDVDSRGIATFHYTGPNNLQQAMTDPRIDNNDSVFLFYHSEGDVNSSAELRVEFKLPLDTHISRNYMAEVVTNGEFSMGIPDKEKTFSVLLKAKDAAGNEVALADENITKITVSTENALIAQIYDTDTNTTVDRLELIADSFILKSKKLSGLVPVKVKVEFTDVNGQEHDPIIIIVNVRVYSGPASAISISYVSTGQDNDRAKYIETLAISVTDEYGNRVNTQPNISLGAIVGYAVDGNEPLGYETNETKRLFYGRTDIQENIANGEINNLGDDNTRTTSFSDTLQADVFRHINTEGNNTDKLVIFGERKNYEAMGKWDISKNADGSLSLQDDYFGIVRSGLYYAAGHNYYQDQCREDGREWIGTTDSETYQLDEEGTVTVTYKYDYHLAGKDALVWVNLDGIQPDTDKKTRVGEVVKHTLRTTGLVALPRDGYLLAKGTSGYGKFDIWHENAPEHYRNAHFGWRPKSGSSCKAIPVASSNAVYNVIKDENGTVIDSEPIFYYDARTCNNGGFTDGSSYITFYLEAPATKDCVFSLDGITTSSEF